MIHVSEKGKWCRGDYEALSKRADDWRRPLRAAGMQRFLALGLPSQKQEAWKYCNLSPLRNREFRLPTAGLRPLPASDIAALRLPVSATVLVFQDGHFNAENLDMAALPSGVVVADLATASRTHAARLSQHLGQVTPAEPHAFQALNTAFLDDGAYVHVPDGVALDTPIYLLHVSNADESVDPVWTHPRVLMILGENASATLIEDYVSQPGANPPVRLRLTNALTEIILAPGAQLEHYRLQREGPHAWHISSTCVEQQRDSSFHTTSITSGGHLTRNDLLTRLVGSGASCQLNGLLRLGGRQFADDHTAIHHLEPDCVSEEDYRAVLEGDAEGVFNGLVHVAPGAQRTSSRQSSHNLLLSDRALMNTKPELQINADDVKCSHGATIGQLDESSLFYLRSRGVSRERAREILVHAFGSDIVDGIKLEPLRQALTTTLFPLPELGD